MKPAIDLVLTTMVDDMQRKLALVPPGGERMMMMGMKVMLGIIARQADDAAAVLVAEIESLRGLLLQACEQVPAALAEPLQAAVTDAADAAGDLRLSALERVRDRLLSRLIELQAWLDHTDGADAAALSAQCWAFLVQANVRRRVPDKPW